MASFIGELQQNQQQARDAEAYRALVRTAEDNSLARNAAAQTKAAYDNAEIGYGLTRAEIAQVTGRPTSEVSFDTLSDQQLQELGYAKQQASRQPQAPVERVLNPEAAINQVVMQQAGADMNAGRLGLAGQLAGRQVDPTRVQGYVDRLPTPGNVEMNAGSQPIAGYSNAGEMGNVMPRDDQEIRMLKQKGAY